MAPWDLGEVTGDPHEAPVLLAADELDGERGRDRVGDSADDLAVGEVAEAHHDHPAARRKRDPIHDINERKSVLAGEPHHGDEQADGRAVARQTTPPNEEDLERVCEVLLGLVEEHVPEARAADDRDDPGREEGLSHGFGSPASGDLPAPEVVSPHEHQGEEDAVPPQLEATELENS